MKKAIWPLALILALCISHPVAAQGANISFDNVAAAFRAAGYFVTGPTTIEGVWTSLAVIHVETWQSFSLFRYYSDNLARIGWDSAGISVELAPYMNRVVEGQMRALHTMTAMLEGLEGDAELWSLEGDMGFTIPPPQAVTRGRVGRFVWFGTPAAMALFESARN